MSFRRFHLGTHFDPFKLPAHPGSTNAPLHTHGAVVSPPPSPIPSEKDKKKRTFFHRSSETVKKMHYGGNTLASVVDRMKREDKQKKIHELLGHSAIDKEKISNDGNWITSMLVTSKLEEKKAELAEGLSTKLRGKKEKERLKQLEKDIRDLEKTDKHLRTTAQRWHKVDKTLLQINPEVKEKLETGDMTMLEQQHQRPPQSGHAHEPASESSANAASRRETPTLAEIHVLALMDKKLAQEHRELKYMREEIRQERKNLVDVRTAKSPDNDLLRQLETTINTLEEQATKHHTNIKALNEKRRNIYQTYQKQQQLDKFYARLETANAKRADAHAMRRFALIDEELMQIKEELQEAKTKLQLARRTESQLQKNIKNIEKEPTVKNTDTATSELGGLLMHESSLAKEKKKFENAQNDQRGMSEKIVTLKKRMHEIEEEKWELYLTGLLKLSPEQMESIKKELWKGAWIEGIHTLLGSRIWTAISGIAGVEMGSAAKKMAIHRALGYEMQSMLSGMLRIVTQVIQSRVNKAGLPRMAPNLEAKSNFNENKPKMKAAMQAVRKAAESAGTALKEAVDDPSQEKWSNVSIQLNFLETAVAEQKVFDNVHDKLWIALSKEFRAKKNSAVVSALQIIASTGALAFEPTGIGAMVAHRLLSLVGVIFQLPASAGDYMKGLIEYPLRMSAKHIDIRQFLKSESVFKDAQHLAEDDFDLTVSLKLWDEQPQLMRKVILTIGADRLAELHQEKLKLGDPSQLLQLPEDSAERKSLSNTEKEFQETLNQLVLFEQHRKLDLNGLIGKAVHNPFYYCWKGSKAGVIDQVGEWMTQTGQRAENNFNLVPLAAGQFSLILDLANIAMGGHVIREGVQSAEGHIPENTDAEEAMGALFGLSGITAFNNAFTVLLARVHKVMYNRKLFGPPERLTKADGIQIPSEPAPSALQPQQQSITAPEEQHSAGSTPDEPTGVQISAEQMPPRSHQTQIKAALKKQHITPKQAKKLEKADGLLQLSSDADVPDRKKAQATKQLEKFDDYVDKLNNISDWIFHAKDEKGNIQYDYYGKPIVIDARGTRSCYEYYVPSKWTRYGGPLKKLPLTIYRSATGMIDVGQSMKARSKSRNFTEGPLALLLWEIRSALLAAGLMAQEDGQDEEAMVSTENTENAVNDLISRVLAKPENAEFTEEELSEFLGEELQAAISTLFSPLSVNEWHLKKPV